MRLVELVLLVLCFDADDTVGIERDVEGYRPVRR